MSLKIRLARAGTKKRPVYHVVVADLRDPRATAASSSGSATSIRCCRRSRTDRLKLDLDKVKAWMAKGAQPTDRIMRFLDEAGVMKRPARSNPEKSKPKKKAQERAAAATAAGPLRPKARGPPLRPRAEDNLYLNMARRSPDRGRNPLPSGMVRAEGVDRVKGPIHRLEEPLTRLAVFDGGTALQSTSRAGGSPPGRRGRATHLRRADRRAAWRAWRGADQILHRQSAWRSRITAPLDERGRHAQFRDRSVARRQGSPSSRVLPAWKTARPPRPCATSVSTCRAIACLPPTRMNFYHADLIGLTAVDSGRHGDRHGGGAA